MDDVYLYSFGSMLMTLTSNFLISRRKLSEKPMRPNLEAEYAVKPGRAHRPETNNKCTFSLHSKNLDYTKESISNKHVSFSAKKFVF